MARFDTGYSLEFAVVKCLPCGFPDAVVENADVTMSVNLEFDRESGYSLSAILSPCAAIVCAGRLSGAMASRVFSAVVTESEDWLS